MARQSIRAQILTQIIQQPGYYLARLVTSTGEVLQGTCRQNFEFYIDQFLDPLPDVLNNYLQQLPTLLIDMEFTFGTWRVYIRILPNFIQFQYCLFILVMEQAVGGYHHESQIFAQRLQEGNFWR